jgi:hypothetical protein
MVAPIMDIVTRYYRQDIRTLVTAAFDGVDMWRSGYPAPRGHFFLPLAPTHESPAPRSNADNTQAARKPFSRWLAFRGCVATA